MTWEKSIHIFHSVYLHPPCNLVVEFVFVFDSMKDGDIHVCTTQAYFIVLLVWQLMAFKNVKKKHHKYSAATVMTL